MKHVRWSFVLTCLITACVTIFSVLGPAVPSLSAATTHARRTPAPTPTQLPNAATYVKTYANLLNGAQQDVTPEDVSVTSDGGSIALALTNSSTGTGLSWLVKLDSSGRPQWQTELGCLSLPPGSYADGVSVHQTTDGGYIVGGGTIGCGSSSSCPPTSGIQCALVEKVDQAGRLQWAYVYPAGAGGSSIRQIRQTSDGGYIAVGSTTDINQNTSALIIKLDSLGTVKWQRELGPGGSSQGFLNAVLQTPDGGYVATGEYYVPTSGSTPESVLVVKLDASGTVQWQKAFSGANSGGVYCYFNGYSESCTDIAAIIYSVHRTADGGYILAGDGDLELRDSVPLVPWLAKVDSSGNLLWQHFYYQVNQSTGRPLSEYFSSSTQTPDGGTLSLGWTENYSTLKGELYGVKTDSTGLVGTCSDQHTGTPLSATDPALTAFSPSLPVQTTITPGTISPSTTSTTAIGVGVAC